MSRPDGGREAMLLPALDKASGGVQWSSVARLVNMVQEANSISKHLRYSLKSRLTCGEEPIVLNTLTVLHTISLNGSLEVRRQLSNTKHLKLLEKVYASFCAELAAAAVCQMLVDWTFMFSHEELGQKSARLMKHLRSKGAPALRATRVATVRREEMMLGAPILRFVPGMDFAAPTSTASGDVRTGGSQNENGDSAPTRGSKLSKLKRLFSRAPSTPVRMRETMSLQTENPRNSRWGNKQKDKTPAWVEEMLARMPVDASDLMEVVGSIETLRESGGSESDISGMMAATEPLAKKVITWHNWAQELVASQMDSIAADMMTGTRQATSKHTNLTLDSSKLTKLLEADDEVQHVVEAWKQLERQVSGQSRSVHTAGPDTAAIVRRSVSVVAPTTIHRKSVEESPNSCTAVENFNRALHTADSATPRKRTPRTPRMLKLPNTPTGQDLCYDQRSGDYAGTCDETDHTPVSCCTDESGTPFGIDLEMRTMATAEESYSYEAIHGSSRLATVAVDPRHKPSSEWRPVEENFPQLLPEDTITFSRPAETYATARANIKEMEEDLRNFGMEPHSQSPRRADEDAYVNLPGHAGPSGIRGHKQNESAYRNQNNPFLRASPVEYSHAGQDCNVWADADVVKPVQRQTAAVVSPFQQPSSSASRSLPPQEAVPVDVRQRQSFQIEENSSMPPRDTSPEAEPSMAIHVERGSQEEPTRLQELSSSFVGICVEEAEQHDDRAATATSAGLSPIRGRRVTPTPADRAQGRDDKFNRKTERRVRTRLDRTRRGAGHRQNAAKFDVYKRQPFGNLAAEGRGSPLNDGEAENRPNRPRHRSPHPSPQRSAEQQVATKKKRIVRRAHKRTRSRDGGRHSVPLLGLENKLLLREGGAAPKIVRASLDALREQRGHRIPALRVRFTQAHLKEVLEKVADRGDI